MVYGVSSTGLQCSWGSKLDETVPRAKMPKCALPPEIRAKLGLDKKRQVNENGAYFKSGFGVVKQKGSETQHYAAGNQKNFLKRRSGVPMSVRTGGLGQKGLINIRPTESLGGEGGADNSMRNPVGYQREGVEEYTAYNDKRVMQERGANSHSYGQHPRKGAGRGNSNHSNDQYYENSNSYGNYSGNEDYNQEENWDEYNNQDQYYEQENDEPLSNTFHGVDNAQARKNLQVYNNTYSGKSSSKQRPSALGAPPNRQAMQPTTFSLTGTKIMHQHGAQSFAALNKQRR